MQIERTEKTLIQKKKELVNAQNNIKKMLVSDVDLSLIEISGTIAKQMETLIETLESELEDKKKRLAKEQLKTNKYEYI
jgi:ATP-dependent protease HslVU (ClpYQ) peptidase subunit